MAEFGVVAALVALACVVVMMGVQADFASLMDTIRGGVTTQTIASTDASTAGTASGVSDTGNSSNNAAIAPQSSNPAWAVEGENIIPAPSQGQTQVCSNNGWCFNVPMTDQTMLSESTGALGGQMTHGMASVLDQIAQQIQAMPNADPQLVNLITQLANQGHHVADQELAAVNWCPPGVYCGEFDSAGGLVSDGLAYNLGKVKESSNAFNQQLATLQSYLSQHPESLPPEVQSVIHFESEQILNIASAYDPSAVGDMTNPNISNEQGSTWSFTNNVALTHQSANTICSQGGNGSCYQNAG